MKSISLLLSASILATTALARTDLVGCVSSKTVNQWNEASMIWYVPDSGEICEFIDCGGGRAPPKYSVPGCGHYTGTATVTPNYLPGYGPGATATTKTIAETASASATKSADSTETTGTAEESSASKTGMKITSAATATATGSGASSTLKTSASQSQASEDESVSGTGDAASPTQTGNSANAMGYNAYGGVIAAAAGLAMLAL